MAVPVVGEERDRALEEVFETLIALDPDQSRIAAALRRTIDQLYDGQNTGRYRWDQLHKTEKTHCGTLVEINLQREFNFKDGVLLDYEIAKHQVDCKYSQSSGGWMIPNEAHAQVCLLVTADDAKSTFSAGIVRARREWLNVGRNRDAKATLSKAGRENILWLARNAQLPPNILLGLPADDILAIFAPQSGQRRVNELFRRAQGRRITRGVVATVAQQADYMKRVRGNGGARSSLAPEGIIVLGHYGAHRAVGRCLGLEELLAGESMSVRVVPADEADYWTAEIDGRLWRVADAHDPVVTAPTLPPVSAAW
ncbi:NaeI family type II restriction endonuclease [Nocardioides iriomotensis]|uniref:Restriction endonuclease n=1 Tax=Nocardioides iriomotensis TaxID=715784 RepID=A0A4Q5IUS7_9ACTN|nr:NaeI family type II restriction endonuclease [Nocardioides iriomotensis]RYU09672.1 restriction endonuclease [Nocardioides iriomotensis]